MKAVIMAGGQGTRLQSVNRTIPKPMFPILGKPILQYQIESLKQGGINDITIVIGHLGNIIREHFQDGEKYGVDIHYVIEEKPLGTAGALYYLKEQIEHDFILVFGDLILDIDWERFVRFHEKNHAVITLFCHPNTHPCDSDIIITDENGKVKGISPKNSERTGYYHNRVNAGVYCVNEVALKKIEVPAKIDFEKNLLTGQIEQGDVYAYQSTEYVKDMGTPERLQSVMRDVRNNIVNCRNLRKKQKAVFLDRDGTINISRGYIKDTADFELLPNVSDAIKMLNASAYLTIVATNQPVIARGECKAEELDRIHMKMETLLGKQGAYVDDLIYCPHHPHSGYAGEIKELKIDCSCRKPKIGMLLQASKKYNIDLEKSWYIGDTTTDIQTGINAGCRTVLVRTGEAGLDGKYDVQADYTASDLLDAVGFILNDIT